MDKTEIYIKMCKKAAKDLGFDGKKKPEIGDWRVESSGKIYLVSEPIGWWEDDTPLYRQDQLQEMILSGYVPQEGGYSPTYWLLHKFKQMLYAATSMEQLWLASAMEEKCNKVWTGEDWR